MLINQSIKKDRKSGDEVKFFFGEDFFTVCESCHAANFSRFTVSSSQPVYVFLENKKIILIFKGGGGLNLNVPYIDLRKTQLWKLCLDYFKAKAFYYTMVESLMGCQGLLSIGTKKIESFLLKAGIPQPSKDGQRCLNKHQNS